MPNPTMERLEGDLARPAAAPGRAATHRKSSERLANSGLDVTKGAEAEQQREYDMEE